MSYCFYNGVSRRGNQFWGSWVLSDVRSIEDNIVKYCRKAFGKNYKDMWIEPVYFDDKYIHYTEEFFSEVGVELYPKITNLSKALKERGVNPPKTKDEWERYNAVVWEIVHSDISKNIDNSIKPVCVVVKGVRYSKDDNEFYEKIKSVKVVNKLRDN